MRIPSSSSFILAATLAVSTSTPSLAAPAAETFEGGMSSSSSNHFIASRNGPVPRGTVDQDDILRQAKATSNDLEQRGLRGLPKVICDTTDAISGLVPPLNKLLHLCKDGETESMQAANAESPEFDAKAVDELRDAVNDVTAMLNGGDGATGVDGVDGPTPTPVPDGTPLEPVTGVVGGAAPAPVKNAMRRDGMAADPSSSSAPTPTTDSMHPAVAPTGSAGTPNNTPNIAAVPAAVPGLADPASMGPIPAPIADKLHPVGPVDAVIPLNVEADPVVGAAPVRPSVPVSRPTAPRPPPGDAVPPAPSSNASPPTPPVDASAPRPPAPPGVPTPGPPTGA